MKLPEWVGEFTNLRLLLLHHNRLTDLPSSLTQLSHLAKIEFSGNPLNSELAKAPSKVLTVSKSTYALKP